MHIIGIIFSLFLLINVAHAETIQLESGKIVEGKIIEETDEMIKIDSGIGIPVTYYLDEIKSIERVGEQKQAEYVVMKYMPELSTFVYYWGDQEVARLDAGSMMTDPRDPNNETVIIGNIPDGPVRHREGIEGNYYYYEYQYVDNKPIKDSTKIYNSQGSQPEDLYIEDGKLNGFYKAYDKKTKATKEEYYKDGKNTEVKFYSEDSLLVAHSIKNYDKDELVIKLYDWEGNLTSETISKISDPQARVLTKRYDKNGNLISEE